MPSQAAGSGAAGDREHQADPEGPALARAIRGAHPGWGLGLDRPAAAGPGRWDLVELAGRCPGRALPCRLRPLKREAVRTESFISVPDDPWDHRAGPQALVPPGP